MEANAFVSYEYLRWGYRDILLRWGYRDILSLYIDMESWGPSQ